MRLPYFRIAALLLGLSLGVGGCSSCGDETPPPPPCEGDECQACSAQPEIVRVEFDPKEGRAPLTAVFTVLGEDDDLDLCEDELLLYHWDFNCDGFEDIKPTKTGRGVKHVFREAGEFKVCMWVTDKDKQASKKTTKFVRVTKNRAPIITSLWLDSYSGESPFTAGLHWTVADADGVADLAKYVLTWGDGTSLTGTSDIAQNYQGHKYTGVGTFKVSLRVYDQNGANVEKSVELVVNTRVLPSNFIQTIGSSKALWLEDNAGAHFSADFGLYDWMLVADGPIGLKVLRYPLDAFSVTAPTTRPVELIGMSDPGGKAGTSIDVAGYGNMAVAGGDGGMYVWNYRKDADAPACVNPWDEGCYPGTPTNPAAFCYIGGLPNFFPSQDFSNIEIIKPSGTGQVWAVGTSLKGTGESGGVSGIRLDLAVNPANNSKAPNLTAAYTYNAATGRLDMTLAAQQWQSLQGATFQVYDPAAGKSAVIKRIAADVAVDQSYVYWAELPAGLSGLTSGTVSIYPLSEPFNDCWENTGLDTHVQANAFGASAADMKVSGDYAYVGFANGGVGVYDLGSVFRLGVQVQSTWMLVEQFPWSVMQHSGAAIALSESRPVTAAVGPAEFGSYASMITRSDCNEAQAVLSGYQGGATGSVLALRGFYENNRVAFALTNGSTDTNGGLGYKVQSFSGGRTVLEGPLLSSPATWATVYPIGVTAYAKLPSYPGANPVSFYGGEAAKVARNGRCLNFFNSYAEVTAAVGVSYDTAPLLFAYLAGDTTLAGIYAFDRSDPAHPKELTPWRTTGYNGPNIPTQAMQFHDDKLYLIVGQPTGDDVAAVLDASDPYHLSEARVDEGRRYYLLGTHSQASGAPPYELNDILWVTPPTNPQGVLLTADGPLGVSALYLDELLTSPPGTLAHDCKPGDWESPCLLPVPDLQLRHEGRISDIELIENRYALVAQNLGGVLVYDITGVAYAGDPTFVTHIRTVSNPRQIKYVTGATEKTLFIADTSSLYKFDNFDPRNLPLTVGSTVKPGYNSGYQCIDSSGGLTFACGGYYDSGQVRGNLFFGQGVTVPSVELFITDSTDTHDCEVAPGSVATNVLFSRLWIDWLGDRLFLFGDSGATFIREVKTDGAGNVQLFSGQARACEWNYLRGSQVSFYQNLPGRWKRFYSTLSSGHLYVWDMDALEDELANPAYDMRNEPNLMGQLDLGTYNGGYEVPVGDMVAIGPYLFLGAGATGAWVLDVSNPINLRLIGRSTQKAPGLQVGALNAIVYANDPTNTTGGYTYLALVSDNSDSGGILMLRYPQLAAP